MDFELDAIKKTLQEMEWTLSFHTEHFQNFPEHARVEAVNRTAFNHLQLMLNDLVKITRVLVKYIESNDF